MIRVLAYLLAVLFVWGCWRSSSSGDDPAEDAGKDTSDTAGGDGDADGDTDTDSDGEGDSDGDVDSATGSDTDNGNDTGTDTGSAIDEECCGGYVLEMQPYQPYNCDGPDELCTGPLPECWLVSAKDDGVACQNEQCLSGNCDRDRGVCGCSTQAHCHDGVTCTVQKVMSPLWS
jgi:hypothetical protein